MADDKKPSAPPPAGPDPFVEIVWLILEILLALYVLNIIANFINALLSGRTSDNYWLNFLINLFRAILGSLVLKLFILSLCLLCIAGIIYLYKKLVFLRTNEQKLLYPEIHVTAANVNPHWERILNHTESLNENDWRLAIIEADIMLGELVDVLGVHGDTMAEKLKAVEKSDFTTIDQAWEGHKIRNQIAHQGSAFAMNQREAKRVIDLYRQVFEEFKMI